MKRIGFITTSTTAAWGGSEELWHKVALLALERKIQVGIFVFKWNPVHPKVMQVVNAGATLFERPLKRSIFQRIIGNLPFFKKRTNPFRSLMQYNPDMILVTDGATYYTVNDLFLANTLLQNFSGKFAILCQGNTRYHMPNNRDFARQLFSGAKYVFFNSSNNQHDAKRQLLSSLENSLVIQNPILGTEKVAIKHTDPKIHIAVPARYLISDKGQDILLEAIKYSDLQNRKVQFNLYGAGTDESYLRELINYLQIGHQVFMHPHTTLKEIWEQNSMLLLPSVMEGTPITLLEGMIAGKVCIATNVGGCNEWIENGKNGYLIEAPTITLIAEKLLYVLDHPHEWDSIEKEAYATAKARIDFQPGLTLLNYLIN